MRTLVMRQALLARAVQPVVVRARRVLAACLITATLALTAAGVACAQDEGAVEGTGAAQQPNFGHLGYGLRGLTSSPNYLDADLGAAWTNNAELTAANERSTILGTVGMIVDYGFLGSNLDFVARGDVNWLHYFDNAFGNTLYGNFNGTVMWGHTTDLLQWVLRDTFTDGQSDPLAAATPANYEEVNYVTTGPYVNLHLGTQDRLTLFGLYSDLTFQRSPFDSQTYDGGVAFTHAIAATESLTLQGDSAYTHYADPRTPAEEEAAADEQIPASSSYNLRSVQLTYEARGERTQLAAGAGYSWEDYGSTNYSGSPLATLQLDRVLSGYSTVYLRGMYGYSSLGDQLRNELSGPLSTDYFGVGPGINAFATAAPLKVDQVSAGWEFRRARTQFTLAAGYARQSYVDEPDFGSKGETATGSLARQLLPTLWLRLTAYGSYYQYGRLNARTTLASENLSVVKSFAKLAVTLYGQRSHQAYSGTPTPLGLETAAYAEYRVGIQLTYDIFGHRPVDLAEGPGLY